MLYESLLLLGVLALTFMLPHLMLGMGFGHALPGWFLLGHVALVLGRLFSLVLEPWRSNPGHADLETPALDRQWRAPSNQPAPVALCAGVGPSLLWFGVGLFWALFDRDHQFLHDRLAGTQLIFKSA
jgi:hypothetical protein